MRSTVGIPLLPAQAVAEGQGGGGCQAVANCRSIGCGSDYIEEIVHTARAVYTFVIADFGDWGD